MSFHRFALSFVFAASCLAVATLAAISASAADAGAPGGTEWVKNVPVFGLELSFS